MKPAPFEYVAPRSLEAALELLSQHGDEAKLLAGGQSLIPAMNFRLLQPTLLIDLNHVNELDFLRVVDGEARLGAMTRQRRLEKDPALGEVAPLLHEAMPFVAHAQIRNRGTLGGSLAHADPAAELPVLAVALDARMRAQSLSGERWIPAAAFFRGFFTTDLQPGEALVEVAIPALPPGSGWAFLEFARRRGDYAIAGVAALVTLDESGVCHSARLVYLNLGEGPVDAREAAGALEGKTPSEAHLQDAARIASETEIEPIGNVHASPEYQRHLARVLTVRALRRALERAAAVTPEGP